MRSGYASRPILRSHMSQAVDGQDPCRPTFQNPGMNRLPCKCQQMLWFQQGSLKGTFCKIETWLFPPKYREATIYKAMFRRICKDPCSTHGSSFRACRISRPQKRSTPAARLPARGPGAWHSLRGGDAVPDAPRGAWRRMGVRQKIRISFLGNPSNGSFPTPGLIVIHSLPSALRRFWGLIKRSLHRMAIGWKTNIIFLTWEK